jgi:hypothetical protein
MSYQVAVAQRSPHSLGPIQKAVLRLSTDKHPEIFKAESRSVLTESKYTELLKERCKKIAAGLASFRNSQLALYEQLAEAILKPYTEYETLPASERKIVEKAVDKFLESTGSKTRKESSMLFKMTKAVIYGPNFTSLSDAEKDRLRRQCSSYAAVVAAAYDEDVAPDRLPEWIAKKHGIERIRLGKTKSGKQSDARRQALPAAVSTFLSAIKHEYETADCFNLNADTEGKQVLLFATYRKGNIEVHGVTTNDKVFDAACKAHLIAAESEVGEVADENDNQSN